jgi:hypothetical protein
MLRHSNPHVKWKLVEDAPKDPRLLGGMFHVLSEDWGWQADHAAVWLAELEDHPEFEAAAAEAGVQWDRSGEPEDAAGDDDEMN